MSMYADYLKEKTNDEIVEADYGFASYRYLNDGKSVYIVDIYIVPSLRKDGLAKSLANQIKSIAVDRGCVEMLGTVVPSAKNSTDSFKVLLAYGMHIHSASNDLIVFRKDI